MMPSKADGFVAWNAPPKRSDMFGNNDWIFTEVDKENIPVPPTYDEVVAAPKFKNVRVQSANHRDEETFYWSLKLKGLYLMYRIWTASYQG